MDFELAEEFRRLKDLVTHFVEGHLFPLESSVLEREATGQGAALDAHLRRAHRDSQLGGRSRPSQITVPGGLK